MSPWKNKPTKTNKIWEKKRIPNIMEDGKQMRRWVDGWMTDGWVDRWMDVFIQQMFAKYGPGNFQELEVQLTLFKTITYWVWCTIKKEYPWFSENAIICSSIERHLCCFNFLATVNNAFMNIYIHLFAWVQLSILLSIYLGVELLAHMIILCLTYWGIIKLFHSNCTLLHPTSFPICF